MMEWKSESTARAIDMLVSPTGTKCGLSEEENNIVEGKESKK